jgi:hypothetical protein
MAFRRPLLSEVVIGVAQGAGRVYQEEIDPERLILVCILT